MINKRDVSLFFHKKMLQKVGISMIFLGLVGVLLSAIMSQTRAISDIWSANEAPVAEISSNIYTTLLDKNLRVIATSNPDTEVDDLYKISGDSTTSQKLYIDDAIKVYFEIKLDEDSIKTIDKEKYYYLTLPSQIIPDESIIVGAEHGIAEPMNLLSNSTIKAIGGIFKDGDQYKFRINFDEFENQIDIAATYQFEAAFSPNIADGGYGLKNLDFGEGGSMPIVVYEHTITPPTPEPDFTLSTTGQWSSKTEKIAKWTSTIVDGQASHSNSGTLSINIPSNMLFEVSGTNGVSENITIAKDDEVLTTKCQRLLSTVKCTFLDGDGNVNAYFESPFDTSRVGTWPAAATSMHVLVSHIDLHFGDESGNPATGIRTWKIEVNTEIYREKSQFLSFAYGANFGYTVGSASQELYSAANLERATTIKASNAIASYKYRGSETTVGANNPTYVSRIPETISKKYTATSSLDYVKINISPRTNATTYEDKYIYSMAIDVTKAEEFINGFELKIDGKTVHFGDAMRNGGSHGIYENSVGTIAKDMLGLSSDSDVVTALETDGRLYRSTETNPDGEYYYAYIKNEYIENRIESAKIYGESNRAGYIRCKTSACRNNDVTTSDNIYGTDYELSPIEFYLINTAGQQVDIDIAMRPIYISFNVNVVNNGQKTRDSISDLIAVSSEGYTSNTGSVQTFEVDGLGVPIELSGTRSNNETNLWHMFILRKYIPFQYLTADTINAVNAYSKVIVSTNMSSAGSSRRIINQNGIYQTTTYPPFLDNQYSRIVTNYNQGMVALSNSSSRALLMMDRANANDGIQYRYGAALGPQSSQACQEDLTGRRNYCLPTYTSMYNLMEQYYADLLSQKLRLSASDGYISGYAFDSEKEEDDAIADMDSYMLFSRATSSARVLPVKTLEIRAHNKLASTPVYEKTVLATNTEISEDGEYIVRKSWRSKASRDPSTPADPTRISGGVTYQFIDRFENESSNSNGTVGEFTTIEPKMVVVGGVGYNLATAQIVSNNAQKAFDFLGSGASGIGDHSTIYKIKSGVYVEFGYFTAANDPYEYSQLSEPDRNMHNGFYLNIYGANYDGDDVYLFYDTKTNVSKYMEGLTLSASTQVQLRYTNTVRAQTDFNGASLADFAVDESFVAQLSVAKSTKRKENAEMTTIPYSRSYTVDAQVGIVATPEVVITDFVSGYIDGNRQHILEKQSDRAAVESLTKSLRMIDSEGRNTMKIRRIKNVSDDGAVEYEDIYTNGEFQGAWSGSDITFYDDGVDGKLYKLTLRYNDGNTTDIQPGTHVVIDYDMSIDMANSLGDDETLRFSDYYNGGELYIQSNVEAERSYSGSGGSSEIPAQNIETLDDYYVNFVYDSKLHVFAGAGVRGQYLDDIRTIKKAINGGSDLKDRMDFKIDVTMESEGKQTNLRETIGDQIGYNVNSTALSSETKEEVYGVVEKHTTLSNLKVVRSTRHATTQSYNRATPETILEYNNTLQPEQVVYQQISEDGPYAEIGMVGQSIDTLAIEVGRLQYDDHVAIYYSVNIDWQSVFDELLSIDEGQAGREIHEWYAEASIEFSNTAILVSNPDKSSKSEGVIEVAEYNPAILKNYIGSESGDAKWHIDVDTGAYPSGEIVITDNYVVDAEDIDIKEAVSSALGISSFKIKLENDTIYDSSLANPYAQGYSADNFTVQVNSGSFVVTLKDTPDLKLTADGRHFSIDYVTHINEGIFETKNVPITGKYTIQNSTELNKADYETSSQKTSDEISYNYPAELTKQANFNPNNPSLLNYVVTAKSGNLSRENITISDSFKTFNELGENITVKDVIISLTNGGVTTDYSVDNLPEGYSYTGLKQGAIEAGNYSAETFALTIARMPRDSIVKISYWFEVDEEQFIADGGRTEIAYVVTNKATLSGDGLDMSSDVASSIMVPELFTKKYIFDNYTEDGKAILTWRLGVNLAEYADIDSIEGAMSVSDQLQEALEYREGSLHVYDRRITDRGYVLGAELVEGTDYTFTYSNRTVTVKILNPRQHSDIEISFKTECLASISDLQNRTELSIQGEKYATISEPIPKVFTNYTSGTVTSRSVATIDIDGRIFLDDDPSSEPFSVRYNHVDCVTHVVYESIQLTNNEHGYVTFPQQSYSEPGVYCYEMYEEAGEEDYNYDDETTYLLVVYVDDDAGRLVARPEVKNSDTNQIVFRNKTRKHIAPIYPPENPTTFDDVLRYTYVILLCMGVAMVILGTNTKIAKRR